MSYWNVLPTPDMDSRLRGNEQTGEILYGIEGDTTKQNSRVNSKFDFWGKISTKTTFLLTEFPKMARRNPCFCVVSKYRATCF